ncbi:hypothetical protein D3C71_972550 [compost metagenome]
MQILIENLHLTVGDRVAERPVVIAGLQPSRGDQHRGFGRTIEVVELALASQLLDDPRLADIAAGHYVIEILQLFQRQNAQQRWRQKGMAQSLMTDQLDQLQRVATLVVAGHDQLGPLQQGRENIDQRGVETQRRKLQHPTLFSQLHIVGVPRAEVSEVGLAEQHAFGMAGGARGIERHARRGDVGALAHQR